MSRVLNCLRCGAEMFFLKREKLQLGQTGYFLGDWPNILAGALETEIYGCNKCGKLEFMMPGFSETSREDEESAQEDMPPEVDANIVGVSMDGIPQVRCPRCGRRHDFDHKSPASCFCHQGPILS